MLTLLCRMCNEHKDHEKFSRCKRFKEGRQRVCRECHHKYYLNNKDKVIERTKKRRSTKEGREREHKLTRARRVKFPIKRMIQEIKSRAKLRGLQFNIEENDLFIPEYCPVLGIPIIVGGKTRSENSPSVDRIEQSLGYVKGNVMVISWRANRLKNDGTIDEFKKILQYMINPDQPVNHQRQE